MRLSGPFFVGAIYYLLYHHTEVFLTIICKVLRKRLGVVFGMIWIAIGVIITFNVIFNHLMAMFIKPGSPTDLAVSLQFYVANLCRMSRNSGTITKNERHVRR